MREDGILAQQLQEQECMWMYMTSPILVFNLLFLLYVNISNNACCMVCLFSNCLLIYLSSSLEIAVEQHYLKNRSERKTVRGDVRVAKETYLEEVRTAQVVPEDSLTSM